MEKHVSSVKEFSDLMVKLKSSGKDPPKWNFGFVEKIEAVPH